jgi:hypothetical protein
MTCIDELILQREEQPLHFHATYFEGSAGNEQSYSGLSFPSFEAAQVLQRYDFKMLVIQPEQLGPS